MNLSYCWSELSRRPWRSLGAMVSIALGIALFISLQAYTTGYRKAVRIPLAQIGADIAAQRQGDVPETFEGPVFPHSTAPIHPDEMEAIQRITGVEAIGKSVLFWDFGSERFLVVLGIESTDNDMVSVGPAGLKYAVQVGRFLKPNERGIALADSGFAIENNIEIGETINIANISFTIVGLADTSRAGQVANANVYISLADAQEIASTSPSVLSVHDFRPEDANILFIKANQSRAEEVGDAVKEILGEQALVSSAQSFGKVLGSSFQIIDRFGWAVGVTGLLVALAGLIRTVTANLRERRRDIAIMRSIGWQRKNVVSQITLELMAIMLIGALLGLGLAQLILPFLSKMHVEIPVPWELSPTPHFLPGGAKEMGITIALPASIELVSTLVILGITVFLGTVTGILLVSRSVERKPAEVLHEE